MTETSCRNLSVKELFDLEFDEEKAKTCKHYWHILYWHMLGGLTNSGNHYYRKCCKCGTTSGTKGGT